MANELTYDEKGKSRPQPKRETAERQRDNRPFNTTDLSGRLDAGKLSRMQQTMGNAAVQRFLAQRSSSGEAELDEETTDAINAQRNHGQALDEGVAQQAGQVMGRDFDDVTVHTDGAADQLSRQLDAKAFTTGSDIFFREGAYNPASEDGQRLIAHELTHVAQQGAAEPAASGSMTVNEPGDRYELEADDMANAVMNMPAEETLQRQTEAEEEEEMPAMLQRQEEEEEAQP